MFLAIAWVLRLFKSHGSALFDFLEARTEDILKHRCNFSDLVIRYCKRMTYKKSAYRIGGCISVHSKEWDKKGSELDGEWLFKITQNEEFHIAKERRFHHNMSAEAT